MNRFPSRRRRTTLIARRRWMMSVIGGLTVAAATAPDHSNGQFNEQSDDLDSLYLPDDVDRSVRAGVDYLVNQQQPDGSIADRGFEVAMTSLAIMAIASIGNAPAGDTRPGKAAAQALEFILDGKQDSDGYFGGRDGSRMYGHGITTLMLTEILGMGASREQNGRIHAALDKAIELILAAQNVSKPDRLAGGWRYTPGSRDSDLSVTVWQLLALRSAKNDGLAVPGEAIDRAIEYLRNSYASPIGENGMPRDRVSGFSYTPGTHYPSFTMTASGLLALQVCGQYESPMVEGSAEWLMEHPPKRYERFFFYGMYYYSQGMHQAGGKYARRAQQLVQGLLLESQQSDGSWRARSGEERNVGTVYATALAVLSLSVRYHYLPIYQR